MTHAELVERVARSIYEGRNGHGCKPWARQTKAHHQPYLADATAAIAAIHATLQEPSEGMMYAGIDEDQSDDVYRDVAGIFRVMLSASPLKEVDG